MLISLSDYGKIHGKSGDTLRRMAENGVLKTARKIGRNWAIDSDELYPVKKRSTNKAILSTPESESGEHSVHMPNASNTVEHISTRYSGFTNEKTNGIVYTPSDLAKYVARQILASHGSREKSYSILDPAIGNGELVVALIDEIMTSVTDARISIFGYETDSKAISQTIQRISERYPAAQIDIKNKDFLEMSSKELAQKYDYIIANPPYIRTQVLGATKAQKIASQIGLDGRMDIYYAFLMLAEKLLKQDGVAGFITSNKFMTIKSGHIVRKNLVCNTDILSITDFGDTKLFSASVLPCVIVFRKKQKEVTTVHTSIYEMKDGQPECLVDNLFDGLSGSKTIGLNDGRIFSIIDGTLQADSDGSPWRVNTASRNSWLERIEHNTTKRFSDLGKIRVGIKTTADNVFIKESWEDEAHLPELLRPLITHRNAGQISSDNNSHWQVLYTHTVVSGKKVAYDIEQYPNALSYLEAHRKQLEGRSYVKEANRNWFEIWVPQNPAAWENKKIVFRDIADTPQFWLDETGAIVNGDCYWMDIHDHTLDDEIYLALAVANSEFIKQYYDICFNNKLYSGKRRFMTQYVEQFPLPDYKSDMAQTVIGAVKEIIDSSPTQQGKEKNLQLISGLVDTLFTH